MAARVTSSTCMATRRLAATTVVPCCSRRLVSSTVDSTAAKVRWVMLRISASAAAARSPSCTPTVVCWRPSRTRTTAVPTACRTPVTMVAISRVERAVRSASPRISLATTPKGRPCSPACAAMMEALSASRFVWSAMSWMTSTMRPISEERTPSESTSSAVFAHRLFDLVHALDAVVDELLAALGGVRHGDGELVRLAGAAAHGVDAAAHEGDEALGLVGEAGQLVAGHGDVAQPLAHGLHQLAGVVGELVEDGQGAAHLLEPLGHLRQGAGGLVGEAVHLLHALAGGAEAVAHAGHGAERALHGRALSPGGLQEDARLVGDAGAGAVEVHRHPLHLGDGAAQGDEEAVHVIAPLELGAGGDGQVTLGEAGDDAAARLPAAAGPGEPGEPPTQQVETGRHREDEEPRGQGARLSREGAQQAAQDNRADESPDEAEAEEVPFGSHEQPRSYSAFPRRTSKPCTPWLVGGLAGGPGLGTTCHVHRFDGGRVPSAPG